MNPDRRRNIVVGIATVIALAGVAITCVVAKKLNEPGPVAKAFEDELRTYLRETDEIQVDYALVVKSKAGDDVTPVDLVLPRDSNRQLLEQELHFTKSKPPVFMAYGSTQRVDISVPERPGREWRFIWPDIVLVFDDSLPSGHNIVAYLIVAQPFIDELYRQTGQMRPDQYESRR